MVEKGLTRLNRNICKRLGVPVNNRKELLPDAQHPSGKGLNPGMPPVTILEKR
jgi:hypothetical protein